MVSINLLTVLLAAVAAFIIGFLLHGPIGGKLWMRLADIHPTGKEKLSDMYGQMFWNLVANFVTAWVLALIYSYAATSSLLAGPGIRTGLSVAFWVWLGFLVTASSIDVIWMGKKKGLWLYEAGCSLIVMLAMGAILAW